MCGAPEQTPKLPPGTDLSKQTVVAGTVRAAQEPVGGAFVRLLDGTGEFTAEVVSSASGQFRFFTAPGSWTVRALHRTGNGEAAVTADGPGLYTVAVTVS
ncbi:MAG TPA: DUF1416 domain-containing protein [Pseudonocardiaceae bacterium]